MKEKRAILLVISIFCIFLFSYHYFTHQKTSKQIVYKGFGWYGYLADDEINEESIKKIKELGGNAVNINVYYEYSLENESFILLSNLTKIKEKIEFVHKNGLKVFLSPFANLVGGHYTGGMITKPENFLNEAKNISIELAKFAQENNVEIYAVWNELGLAIHKLPNSINLTNEWLQDVREEVRKVYKGILTTKEGVQFGLYESYNFSGYDCIGLTFYPFTTSFAKDPYTNFTYAGVESLEEYEKVVKEELKRIEKLEKKFNINCTILGEIGIDVVGGKFVGNDEESKKIRSKAYEIVLKNGIEKIDGFFFSKFERLNIVFMKYFSSSLKIPINNCSTLNGVGSNLLFDSGYN
jgi:predicted DNA-binding transcriptional regulator